jgi:glycosyltransferase involved in cell wall biosynthesis
MSVSQLSQSASSGMIKSDVGPRLCFVGPMVGANAGRVTTQGERLAALFAQRGYRVISVSKSPNRYIRLLDIIWTLIWRSREIDVQVLQVFGGPSFVVEDAASFLGRLLGQRIVMIMRGGAMPTFMARYPRWSRRVLARADAMVAPSNYLQRSLAEWGYQLRVIPNVIELSSYKFRLRSRIQPRLFWMRAFHPEIYNPAMAIRTFARVRQVFPDATLVMAGQHDEARADVERLAQELGVADAVRFAGFLDMEGKASEAEKADVFINTNNIDNMPVSIVEALAMGLPVVATNVGGIPDLVVHEQTALLVAANDDEAMAEAVIRLVRDPALAERLSTNGRAYAESCGWERVRAEFEDVIATAGIVSPRQNNKETDVRN